MIEVPRTEIIKRVFAISPDQNSCGSAFAYAVNGLFCFITAAHVLGSIPHGKKGKLHVFKDDNWLEVEATPLYVAGHHHEDGDIDIVVVKTNIPSNANESRITLSSEGVLLGQDVYFLGFPYFGNAINHRAESFNANFPIPFIKKATMSALHDQIIYLDGHNNPGFSGGPVVFWDYSEKTHKILGVISSYLTHAGEIKKIETSVKECYLENSGIGIAYKIEAAEELIQKIENSSVK